MKKLLTVCVLALILAAGISLTAQPVAIEQKLIQIHASEVLADFPDIEQEPIEFQAILLDMADDPLLLLKAHAALIRYPEMTRSLFPLYAEEPEFQDILRRYGENILPPIYYFYSRPISTIEWMNTAARKYQAITQFFSGEPEKPALENKMPVQNTTLSPQERGWYAVNFIQSEGHDFLGQFIVDDTGNIQWVGTERVLEGLNQFFASGIRDLEIKRRTGEEISGSDVGWVSLDVLVFASAAKVLRMGRAAAVTTRSASRGTRSAVFSARVARGGQMVLKSARYAKWPAIVGVGYLVIRHPSIINDLLAGVADVLGYPVIAVQFLGWLLLLLPALYVGSWLLWLLAPLLRAVSFTAVRLSGRRRAS